MLKAIGKKTAKWLGAGAAATAVAGPVGFVGWGAAAATAGTAKVAGKALRNQSHPASKALFGVVAGGAMATGATAELFNDDGPWKDVAESFTGSRDYLNYTARASIGAAFTNNEFQYNQGPLDYYEGANVNPQALHRERRRRIGSPDGSMVMGMYNLRRG